MKRRLTGPRGLVGFLATAALAFAACGGAATTTAPAASAPAASAPAASAAAGEPKLEIFSWWTAGGEAEGLNAMFDVFKAQHSGVEIVNAAVAGGAGSNAKAVLATRLAGGDPPDAFQVHAGLEILTYSPDQYLQPLDDLYAAQGWDKVFPKDLLTLLKYNGHYWSVPVNIHRGNVLWYNKQIFADNGLTPPKTFDDFFKVADALKAKGITPYAFGNNGGWEDAFTFESVLLGSLGADGYKGLWTGATQWTDPRVAQALETYKKMATYANADHAALSWDGAAQLIVDGKAAMFIHGDWANGYFLSKGFAGYGWAPAPGTSGIFHVVSDSFALPKGAKDPQNAQAWLELAGSKAGQEAFNPKKGSICARTDCDQSLFGDYSKSAAADFASNALVPGTDAAANPKWITAYKDVIALFVSKGDVAAAQTALQQACVDAGVCK